MTEIWKKAITGYKAYSITDLTDHDGYGYLINKMTCVLSRANSKGLVINYTALAIAPSYLGEGEGEAAVDPFLSPCY